MKIDIRSEIVFQTARSGGKGGQNVNKVETMVEGRWKIDETVLFSQEQKEKIKERLKNKIVQGTYLLVTAQTARTQLENKQQVIEKMNLLVEKALYVQKARKTTQPTKASKEKRLQAKKNNTFIKANRKKPNVRNLGIE